MSEPNAPRAESRHQPWASLDRIQREVWLSDLDPGIAPYVDVLDAAGIETFESCQGGEGHSFAEPAVRFFGESGEGFRALAVAVAHRLPVFALRRYWDINRAGEPCGPYWEMTFSVTASTNEPVPFADQTRGDQS